MHSFSADIRLRKINIITPPLLSEANKLIKKLLKKNLKLSEAKKMLIELAQTLERWLSSQNPESLNQRSLLRFEKVKSLRDVINGYIHSSESLRNFVWQVSGQAEEGAEVETFSDVFMKRHPTLVEYNQSGVPILKNLKAAKQYDIEEAQWKLSRQQARPKIMPDPGMNSPDEQMIQKIILNDVSAYQAPLRDEEFRNSWSERGVLLENIEIINAFSRYKPEKVTADRYALTFPDGESNPHQLQRGKRYVCPGYMFVGGERSSDDGFKMRITLNKGYPVDAHGLYGHQYDAQESKMQWVTLPGAVFVFKGVKTNAGEKVFLFNQVNR